MIKSTHAATSLVYETFNDYPTAENARALIRASEARGELSAYIETDHGTADEIRKWAEARSVMLITSPDRLDELTTVVGVAFFHQSDCEEFQAWINGRNRFFEALAQTQRDNGPTMNRRARRAGHGPLPGLSY